MNFNVRNLYKGLAIIILFSIFTISHSQTIHPSFCDGRIYFKIKDNYTHPLIPSQEGKEKSIANISKVDFLQKVASQYNFTNLTQPFTVNRDQRLLLTYELDFSNYKEVDSLIHYLKNLDFIEYAEKVPLQRLLYKPNDPLYNTTIFNYNWKWWLDKVNAENAWDITKGSSSVKVGIIDNALWTSHPDLSNQVTGQYDFADNDSDVNPPAGGTNAQQYYWSHGTHISGIIAAVQDNNIGITGISPQVKLLFCKGAKNNSDGMTINHGIDAINWMANNNANVINMSWGSDSASVAEQDLMTACYNAGIVMVAGAGNNGKENKFYPAAYNHVISVASIDDNNHRSDFSQFGNWITISAPGGLSPEGATTYNISILSTTFCNAYDAADVFPGQKYDLMQGTSMSAPVVSGICALMLSVNPELKPADVTRCLKLSAVNIDNVNPGYEGKLGAGYPDAYAAVKCAQTASQLLADFKANKTNISKGESVNFTDYSSGNPTSWTWAFQGGTPSSSNLQNPSIMYKQSGIYSVTLTVTNGGNTNSKTMTNYINVIVSSSSCDTVRYPLKTPYFTYTVAGGGGYFTGNNKYGFLGLAEYFSSSDYSSYNQIEGGAVKFGVMNGLDKSTVTFAVWDNKLGHPTGSPLATKTVSLGTIRADIEKGNYTFVDLDSPVTISGPFYMGIILPTSSGDTTVIISDSTGSVNPCTAWVYLKDGWSSFTYSFYNNFNVRLAISPIMCEVIEEVSEINNSEPVKIYPNPAQNLVNILFSNKIFQKTSIRLFDLYGKEIKIFQTSDIMSGNKIQLDISGLPTGLYLLNISSGSTFLTKKISIIK